MLYSTTFLTLDGVMSDPHVWFPPFASEDSLALLAQHMDAAEAMLIGRRTYEEFADWWPRQPDSAPLAGRTNAMPKYVVTGTLDHVDWTGSRIVAPDDLPGTVAALGRRRGTMAVVGSATLQRSLLRAGLLDELRIYLAPVVLAEGSRLFDGTTGTSQLELADQQSLPNGVQYLAYRAPVRPAVAAGPASEAARG